VQNKTVLKSTQNFVIVCHLILKILLGIIDTRKETTDIDYRKSLYLLLFCVWLLSSVRFYLQQILSLRRPSAVLLVEEKTGWKMLHFVSSAIAVNELTINSFLWWTTNSKYLVFVATEVLNCGRYRKLLGPSNRESPPQTGCQFVPPFLHCPMSVSGRCWDYRSHELLSRTFNAVYW